jgi:hypothetical protein
MQRTITPYQPFFPGWETLNDSRTPDEASDERGETEKDTEAGKPESECGKEKADHATLYR